MKENQSIDINPYKRLKLKKNYNKKQLVKAYNEELSKIDDDSEEKVLKKCFDLLYDKLENKEPDNTEKKPYDMTSLLETINPKKTLKDEVFLNPEFRKIMFVDDDLLETPDDTQENPVIPEMHFDNKGRFNLQEFNSHFEKTQGKVKQRYEPLFESSSFFNTDVMMPVSSYNGLMLHTPSKENKIDSMFHPSINTQDTTMDRFQSDLSINQMFNMRKNEKIEVNTEKTYKQMEREAEQEKQQEIERQKQLNKEKIMKNKHIFKKDAFSDKL